MLPFVISGLVAGSVYGLIGTGVVLTYRVSGVFNFAHGALATIVAYVFYFLYVQHGVPLGVTIAICVVVLAPAMGLGLEPIAARLARVGLALQVAATVGLILAIEAVFYLWFGPASLDFPHFLPQQTFSLGGARVSWEQAIVFLGSLAVAAGLYVFLRRMRLGKAMRAVVDDPDLLSLAGTSPGIVRRTAWIVSCVLVALSGLALAPSVGLTPETLTLLVVQGFAAAAIGAFRNVSATWIGGLVVGVAASIATEEITSFGGVFSNLAAALPFVILFVVILVMPRRSAAIRSAVRSIRSLNPTWTLPMPLQLLLGGIVLIVLCFVPEFAGFRIDGWSTALIYVILLLSLGLLVRRSGQVSLCVVTFAAIGAVAFSKFMTADGLPWLPALVAAGVIAIPIGALLAIPAIRLSGLYLALATFGFGLLVQDMFYQTSLMFGLSDSLAVRAPSWLGLGQAEAVYYAVLAVGFVLTLAVLALVKSRAGRLFRALSDSPVGLASYGTNVISLRVLVFCVAAFLAAISGALLGAVQSQIGIESFDPQISLELFALVVIAIGGEPWYALPAGLGLALIPTYIGGTDVQYYLQLLFGVSAVMVGISPPPRLPARWRLVIDGAFRRRGGPEREMRIGQSRRESGSPSRRKSHVVSANKLEIRGLDVRFGGLHAVDDLSLVVKTGEITGLIGPNGAGKTTTFEACSGLIAPDGGAVRFGGRDISRLGVARRARLGIGRTFQHVDLFESMTVAQNVAMGREASFAGGRPWSQILSLPAQRQEVEAATREAIAICGLESTADMVVSDLSTGQRKLAEMARCLAGPFDILLLDEPSSGLDRRETKQFGLVLERAVKERGIGILLVEHDMSLVMDICKYVYVLDFGKLVFEGTPIEVRASSVVQSAYLGVDAGMGGPDL